MFAQGSDWPTVVVTLGIFLFVFAVIYIYKD